MWQVFGILMMTALCWVFTSIWRWDVRERMSVLKPSPNELIPANAYADALIYRYIGRILVISTLYGLFNWYSSELTIKSAISGGVSFAIGQLFVAYHGHGLYIFQLLRGYPKLIESPDGFSHQLACTLLDDTKKVDGVLYINSQRMHFQPVLAKAAKVKPLIVEPLESVSASIVGKKRYRLHLAWSMGKAQFEIPAPVTSLGVIPVTLA